MQTKTFFAAIIGFGAGLLFGFLLRRGAPPLPPAAKVGAEVYALWYVGANGELQDSSWPMTSKRENWLVQVGAIEGFWIALDTTTSDGWKGRLWIDAGKIAAIGFIDMYPKPLQDQNLER